LEGKGPDIFIMKRDREEVLETKIQDAILSCQKHMLAKAGVFNEEEQKDCFNLKKKTN